MLTAFDCFSYSSKMWASWRWGAFCLVIAESPASGREPETSRVLNRSLQNKWMDVTVHLWSFFALSKCDSRNWVIFFFYLSRKNVAFVVSRTWILSPFFHLYKMWPKLLLSPISLSNSAKMVVAAVHSRVIFPNHTLSTHKQRTSR